MKQCRLTTLGHLRSVRLERQNTDKLLPFVITQHLRSADIANFSVDRPASSARQKLPFIRYPMDGVFIVDF
jgi:hypothetical protein